LDEDECTLDSLKHVFRSATEEEMPMLKERLMCLREAGQVLDEVSLPRAQDCHALNPEADLLQLYDCSITNLVHSADGSAAGLVNILARDFACFRDEHHYKGRAKPVRFLKRAQIFVADLWACFGGESYGEFWDIDKITMFADYRIPQILISLNALYCSPTVAAAIKDRYMFESGGSWEMQLRGEPL
jgi:hypothetical protein